MEKELLYVLGTGNAAVTKCYNTCFAIKEEDEYFMVDTGGGNGILAVLEDMEIPFKSIHHIFITHEHCDHMLGIIWMIRMIAARMHRKEYDGDLHIYCHDKLQDTINTICKLTLQRKFYTLIGDRIHIIPLRNGEVKHILGLDITFFDIHSTKARQFGFTTMLKNGRKLTCTGDEPYNDRCEDYVRNSTWLLHEAFCLYGEQDRFRPYEKHHSTVKEACELAERLHIPNLVLWHTEDKHITERKKLYREEGSQFYHGRLFVPDDREMIEL